MASEPRSKTEPQAGLSIEQVNGEAVIFLTVPEDAPAGTRVALWTSEKALERLEAEINRVRFELRWGER